MTVEEEAARADLADLLEAADVQVVLAWRRSATNWRVNRLQMHGDLPADFREIAVNAALPLLDQRLDVLDYNPEVPLAEDQAFLLINDPLVGGDLFPQLDTFADIPWFMTNRRRSATPNLLVIICQNDQETAFFGRKLSARNTLGAKWSIRAVFDGETFSRMEPQKVFFFDNQIDWIEWRREFLILDDQNFHALFRDVPALRASVDAHLAAVVQHFPIENLELLAERCKSNVRMMAKLQSIINRRNFEKPIDLLREYDRRYEIGVEWDADGHAVFDGSLENQWRILRLLDEARYTGPLSGEDFEAASKIPRAQWR